MTVLTINAFGGMEGRIKQRSLRDMRLAAYAKNTRLWDGSLRAYKSPKKVADCTGQFTANVKRQFSCVVGAAEYGKSPCGGTSLYTLINGRLAEDGRVIGIERPTETPTVSSSNNGEDATIFRVVCVNEFGEASQPSTVSNQVNMTYGDRVVLDWGGCTPYRVEAMLTQSMAIAKEIGKDTTQWVVVGEFNTSKAIFDFKPECWAQTADGYDPMDYCHPPEMCGFTISDDGYWVGWKGSALFISERHEPSKFIRSAIKNLHAEIYEVVTARGALYISTEDGVYIARLTPDKDGVQVGITQTYENFIPTNGTLSLLNSGAMYSTNYGLAVIDESSRQPQIVSSKLIPEDDYEANWLPISGVVQRGVFYATDKEKSWHLDFPSTSGDAAEFGKLVVLDSLGHNQYAGKDGVLYYSNSSGTQAFDRGDSYLAAEWESTVTTLAGVTSFSRYKVTGQNLDGVTMNIVVDGESVYTTSDIHNDAVCTLPLCVSGIDYSLSFKLPASSKEIVINKVQLATSMKELSRV